MKKGLFGIILTGLKFLLSNILAYIVFWVLTLIFVGGVSDIVDGSYTFIIIYMIAAIPIYIIISGLTARIWGWK